jgi:predicted transcriptional regulator YdeE
MLSSDVQEMERPATLLVGLSIRASLNEIVEKKLGDKLRQELAARRMEISHTVNDGVFLVQIYERDPRGWTPDSPFTQVIAKEVGRIDAVPDGMVSHTIPAGSYIKFQHRGPMRDIGASYDAMHAWLAKEQRGGPCPFDFEYWEDASRLEDADTTIGIHLPLLPSGKVGA